MTEEEAKQKWCPMMRYIIDEEGDDVISNRCTNFKHEYGAATDSTTCIASDCMMWRWNKEQKPSVMDIAQPVMESTTSGYCGLGGKS